MVASPRGYGWAREHPIPTFVHLAGRSSDLGIRPPDHLNMPMSARYPKLPGLTHEVCAESLPDRRSAFTISEAALSRLLAPTTGARGTSGASLVDELSYIARDRLSTADIMALRDQLTSVLEEHSGRVATAATAVRASRHYEATMKAGKPISIRDVTIAFPQWPPQVQANFLKSVLKQGKLPYTDDNVAPAAMAIPDGSRLPEDSPTPLFAVTTTDASVGGFPGLQGSMLQPLGQALPALRPRAIVPSPMPGGNAPPIAPPNTGSGALSARETARERSQAPSRQSQQLYDTGSRAAGTPRLAAMGSSIEIVEAPGPAGTHAPASSPNVMEEEESPSSGRPRRRHVSG